MENVSQEKNNINNTAKLLSANAQALANEVNWFSAVVNAKLHGYMPASKPEPLRFRRRKFRIFNYIIMNVRFSHAPMPPQHKAEQIAPPPPPDLKDDKSIYAEFVNYYKLTPDERILLILVLIPQVQPNMLDIFFSANKSIGRGYTEFGGLKGNKHSGFIPTVETALFLLAGKDLTLRFSFYRFFEPDHIFAAHNIISIDRGTSDEPFYSSAISISDEYVDFFTTGQIRKPRFSTEFPAKLLTTKMEWEDLVVDQYTRKQVDELRIWLEHGPDLLNKWHMDAKLKPGYKVLFYGPPGTGKTLTAALLGKVFKLDVYRIDLSMVISKYIGETEKNLEKVFRRAEHKNWILFFDEADALFGKRTSISDAHDKYANQEIAYLLQRLEDYPGLVILASNMRNNVDEAFTRRLQSIIHFATPKAQERVRLWTNAFSPECIPPAADDILHIATQYELAGGSIINVVQYASLMALGSNRRNILIEDILEGVKKEFSKEGKTL